VERPRKKREEIEHRYVANYVASQFPDAEKVFLQPPVSSKPFELGQKEGKKGYRWYWRYGPRADAIVIHKGKLILIEAETKRPVTGLSEIEEYSRFLHENPLLGPYLKLPREFHLVTPVEDPKVMQLCAEKGIKYVLYRPDWIIPHLKRWGVIPE